MTVDQDWIKQVIDGVREDIGRTVSFYTSKMMACSLCAASGYYDSVNDTTFYFTCPVCDGAYYLPTVNKTDIIARVHWTNDEAITATPGGKYFSGDAQITIENKYLSLAESVQTTSGKVVVDGHDMSVSKIIPIGAFANRFRLILQNMGDRPS